MSAFVVSWLSLSLVTSPPPRHRGPPTHPVTVTSRVPCGRPPVPPHRQSVSRESVVLPAARGAGAGAGAGAGGGGR